MNDVFDQLSQSYPDVVFVKVAAEEVEDVTERFEITSVPSYIFLKNGQVVDKLIGGHAPELAKKVETWVNKLAQEQTISTETQLPSVGTDLQSRIKQLVNYAPIMLFMKGVPDAPECGYSSQIVEILKKHKVTFSAFNILSDSEIREGLKEYANWRTYPQLWVNGELVGGLDVVREMDEEGELIKTLQPAIEATKLQQEKSTKALNERLSQLINQAPVMLFMKGTSDAPRCGFSSQIVGILHDNGIKFSSFNILSDQDVRDGLKVFSNWRTYPQLYVEGKLVGGLDIVKELAEEGQLRSLIPNSCLDDE